MVVKGLIKTGAYFDSVTLMIAARELALKRGHGGAADLLK